VAAFGSDAAALKRNWNHQADELEIFNNMTPLQNFI